MFKNFMKITIRTLLRNKGYSFINIAGLTIGITSFILIILFVRNELGYDSFHERFENIHRVNLRYYMGSNKFDMALGPVPLAFTLKEDFPEIIAATRLYHSNYRGWITYVTYEEKQFAEEGFLYADSTFFDVFSLNLLEGDPKTALKDPSSIILTTETAIKYFGDTDPMGKLLKTQDGNVFRVTGISGGMPVNSHFKFDLLANFSSHPKSRDPDWYDTAVYTYIVLQDNFPSEQLKAKLPDFSRKYVEPVLTSVMGISYDDFIKSGNYFGFFMEPLSDVHLYSKVENGLDIPGDINIVIMFSAIAIVILLVACINFINLTTARSLKRANEVGVRKVVGAGKKQLIVQFLSESMLIITISTILGLLLVFALLPEFSNLIGKSISSDLITNWNFIPIVVAFILLMGLFAGSYPAFLLSSFRPVMVLKSKSASGEKGRSFRNGLVVFQFVTSIVLIIGTIVIDTQMNFIRNKDLGFDKEQVVVIHSVHKLRDQKAAFKEELLKNPAISSASYSDCLPQVLIEIKPFRKENALTDEDHTLITIMTDYDFLKTYQVNLTEGRFLEEGRGTDSSAVLLNEAAVKAMDIKDPLNERVFLTLGGKKALNIIGVLKDFHMESLHEPIKPTALMMLDKYPAVLLSLKVGGGDMEGVLNYAKEKWNQFLPGQPFEYVFYDDKFDSIYKNTIQSGRIFSSFSILAILIACLGLFGLASYTAERKTKEIGIRKIMGASEKSILFLLIKEFLKWVVLASLIAFPAAYFLMSKWLQGFAFRIDMQMWMYLFAAFLAIMIAVFTVGYQSIKASRANPVDALKYE